MAGSAGAGTRVAIVTGGSRGIGRSIVGRLAGEGYRVVVVYASNETEANAAVAEAAAAGGEAIAIAADVADEAAMAGVFDRAEQEFVGVDVVVNAAGVMSLAPLAEFDLDVLDAMLRTNIRARTRRPSRG